MSQLWRTWLIAGVALCAWAGSEDPQPGGQTAGDALAQQRSVSAMQASLKAQRDAIHKQLEQAPQPSFFLLKASLRTAVLASPPPACDPLPAAEIDSLVAHAANREGLDPDLLRRVMQQESAFRPCALSGKGAMGLMQLMPATAAALGLADPFNPEENLFAGARFLKQLLNRYTGNIALALGAYNAGPARVDEYGGIPPIPETMNYIQRVLMLLPARQ